MDSFIVANMITTSCTRIQYFLTSIHISTSIHDKQVKIVYFSNFFILFFFVCILSFVYNYYNVSLRIL